MTAKRRLGTTGYYVVSILIAVVAMIPFLWMISTSLKSRGALMSIPIEWIPAEPSLDAYGEVFSRFPFLKTIGNSLFISVSYTVITLISASMAAFAFAKIRFRCANLLLKLYLATMMIPTQVTMIPQTYVELTDEQDLYNINKILSLLDEDDDVQEVYHNWDE